MTEHKHVMQPVMHIPVQDPHDGQARELLVRATGSGVEIGFPGCGAPGVVGGYPIYVEFQNGVPVVYVWPDINSTDEPWKIFLTQATEDQLERTEETDQG